LTNTQKRLTNTHLHFRYPQFQACSGNLATITRGDARETAARPPEDDQTLNHGQFLWPRKPTKTVYSPRRLGVRQLSNFLCFHVVAVIRPSFFPFFLFVTLWRTAAKAPSPPRAQGPCSCRAFLQVPTCHAQHRRSELPRHCEYYSADVGRHTGDYKQRCAAANT